MTDSLKQSANQMDLDSNGKLWSWDQNCYTSLQNTIPHFGSFGSRHSGLVVFCTKPAHLEYTSAAPFLSILSADTRLKLTQPSRPSNRKNVLRVTSSNTSTLKFQRKLIDLLAFFSLLAVEINKLANIQLVINLNFSSNQWWCIHEWNEKHSKERNSKYQISKHRMMLSWENFRTK